MDISEYRYYSAIGKIQSCAASAETFHEAVCGGIRIMLENGIADYAVLWYMSDEKTACLAPYYWICPVDLTARRYAHGEGIVGRVFSSGKAEVHADPGSMQDPAAEKDMSAAGVSGLICLPFSVEGELSGCIEFMKSKDHGEFTAEETSVCEVMTLLAQMAMYESAPPLTQNRHESVLLSVRNINKTYRSGDELTHVLKGVNFDVFRGEFLCFLGESGCGKSSMLNILGGLLSADDGSILFEGEEMIGKSQKQLTKYRRDNIGYIFQSYNLMPNLNARQNLELIGELVKEPMNTDELLSMVGMSAKGGNYPSQLSGGQQQRIAIARALVKKPKLILADEPTAALDYDTSIEVLTVMEHLVEKGTTLVMVTHNEEITKMADRVIRFRGGKTYEVTVNRRPRHAADLVW